MTEKNGKLLEYFSKKAMDEGVRWLFFNEICETWSDFELYIDEHNYHISQR